MSTSDDVVEQPLDGLKVLDLSEGVAGPFCAKILADYGASVVKVESPDGDVARRAGPYPGDAPDPDRSGLFLHLNTNKRGLIADVGTPAGVEIVRELALRADVVIDSWIPGRAPVGLDPRSLLVAAPGLVVGSVTPFGQYGPYCGYTMSEIVAYAMGGPMNSSGLPDREPVKLVGNSVLMQSGSTAASAVLAAVWNAQATGVGQHVDVATYETQNGSLDRRRYYLLSYQYSGYVTQRAATVGSAKITIGGRYPTADGRTITTGMVWSAHVGRMVSVIGAVDARVTEEYAMSGDKIVATRPELVNEAIAAWAASRTAQAAMREAQASGWPVVVVNDPLSLLLDDHFVRRGFFVDRESPTGTVTYCGAPWRIDGGGWALRSEAPLRGEHTDEVVRDLLDLDDERIVELRKEGIIA